MFDQWVVSFPQQRVNNESSWASIGAIAFDTVHNSDGAKIQGPDCTKGACTGCKGTHEPLQVTSAESASWRWIFAVPNSLGLCQIVLICEMLSLYVPTALLGLELAGQQ